MDKILVILTNHATLGDTSEVNGTFAPELTHVIDVLWSEGFDFVLASIEGGEAPLYGTDLEGDTITSRIMASPDFRTRVSNTIPASEVNIEDYVAVFYPGGFGLLSDLAINEEFARLSAQHYEAGGVLAAVCHGPAGLLPIALSSGEMLLADKSVTGFTEEEEINYGTIDKVPFVLADALKRNAKSYSKAEAWQEYIVTDGRIITGQNPASAAAVGRALVEQLKARG